MTPWPSILGSRWFDIGLNSATLAGHFVLPGRALLARFRAVNPCPFFDFRHTTPRRRSGRRDNAKALGRWAWWTLLALLAVQAQAHAESIDPSTLGQARQLALQAASLATTQSAQRGARIEIVAGAPDPRLRLAPCERIEAYLPAGVRIWGRTRIGLRCLQGPTLWNVSLPLTVRVFAPGVVVTASLPAGTVLGAEHLAVAEIDWAADKAPAFVDPAGLLGRTLARPLAAGSTPRSPDIKARQWFAAGDTVRLVASGPGFAISGDAQALSPGVEGQPARVRTESGRIVTGQPVGERQIEVAL